MLLASCSGLEDEGVQQGDRTVTLRASIGFDEAPRTRALTPEGKKTFSVGDKIAVVYTDGSDQTVKTESEPLTAGDISYYGKKAVITVTLSDPKPEGSLTYIYPSVMAAADGSVNYSALDNQDGSLSSLSSDLDLCCYRGKLNPDATLPDNASLANELTILELTVNNNSTDITETLTDITLTDGTYSYAVTTTGPSTPIYIAMRELTQDKTLSFEAHNGAGETFRRTVEEKILRPGYMHPVNLRMNRIIDLSLLTSDHVAVKDDWLTGTLSSEVGISVPNGASITLCDADINGSGTFTGGTYAGITCLGSATLTLEGTNTVKGFGGAYPGIFVPSGKTLTISGTGSLDVANNGGTAAGIGAGTIAAGNITITGGTVTATGGVGAAGIGAGSSSGKNCGNILITGGTVTAYGGEGGAGIGAGAGSTTGWIQAKRGITKVVGIKGAGALDGIGRGTGGCGDVYFHNTRYYYSGVWHPNPMKSGTYDGLKLTISTTTVANDTWTLVE